MGGWIPMGIRPALSCGGSQPATLDSAQHRPEFAVVQYATVDHRLSNSGLVSANPPSHAVDIAFPVQPAALRADMHRRTDGSDTQRQGIEEPAICKFQRRGA
jgi:hypothetical protein